jgi:hypothetical protein
MHFLASATIAKVPPSVLARRPTQLPLPKDVQMKMVDALGPMLAIVDH